MEEIGGNLKVVDGAQVGNGQSSCAWFGQLVRGLASLGHEIISPKWKKCEEI
jgi:hypothetical protein